jgi:hypothetical protein
MTIRHHGRGAAKAAAILILALALLAAACGEEEVEVTTTQASTTSSASSTTSEATTTSEAAGMVVSQIELLSGMLQGLLTADEAGAAIGAEPGLVDQGRRIIPAGSSQRTGFLCPEGQAILDPLGSAYDPQVSVSFAPGGEAGRSAWVTESLLYEEAAQNAADFATLVAAIDACAGIDAWTTPDAGRVRIERLDWSHDMGDEAYAYRIAFNEGTGQAPQMETRAIAIRVGPGLLEVSANMIRDAAEPAAIGDGGLQNIAEAALAKVEEGLAGSEPFTVEAADPETIMYYAGLLAGLLTTEEIGGGWVDQGRMIVPPSATGQGFSRDVLCPEGQAIYEPIGSGLDQQVFTTYSREGSPSVTEYLVWGHRDQLTRDFATSVAAVEACFDREPWETDDAGTLRMHALDLPSLGAQSIAYYVGPGTMPGADPWVELQIVSILVTNLDPSNDNSVVISIAVSTIHDPAGAAVETLDQDEIVRIAQAAIDRFEYDG